MRIFKDNLDDGIIEIIKLKHIVEYGEMNLLAEYITYENHDETNLYFSKRNDSDNILKTYTIPLQLYFEETKSISASHAGDWHKIDREWAITQTEEKL